MTRKIKQTPNLANASRSRGVAVWFALATMLAIIWLVYSRSLGAPFIFDDVHSVVENRSITRLWPLVGNAAEQGPLQPPLHSPTRGRPLVNLSFALNYQMSELDPRGYRLVNIALHATNVLLLAALVWRTLRLPIFTSRFEKAAGPLAFLVALLWAVHPLATETVVYITQRTELMVTCFYLSTFYASLRYCETTAPKWLVLAVLACWAGMATKEVMVTAPVMWLLYDRAFLSGSLRAAWEKSKPLYLGLFSSWALLLFLNYDAPRSASTGFHHEVSAAEWWYTQSKILLMYLKLVVWPWPLSIHYEPPYLTNFREAWHYVLPVAFLVFAGLLMLWRKSAAGYLVAFALAILAPTLVIPIVTEIAAERRMYLPLAALLSLIVFSAYALLRQRLTASSALATIAVSVAVLALAASAVSLQRLAAYESEISIWHDLIACQPDSYTAHYNLGTLLLEQGSPQTAVPYLERAIAIKPGEAQAHHNLGAVWSTLGQPEKATRYFRQAVEIDPEYALGHAKLGIIEMKAGKPEQAHSHFETALQCDPNDPIALAGMAEALLALGQPKEAIAHARHALDFEPVVAHTQNVLGAALAQQGQLIEATEHFEAAVRLDPTSAQAHGNLMAAYASLGRVDEAVATAQKALAMAQANGEQSLVVQIEAFLTHLKSNKSLSPVNSREGASE